jgi:anti-sigma B factor antagonist
VKTASLQIAHSEPAPGIDLITLAGRIMLGTDNAAVEEMITALLRQGRRKIIVDLSAVTHIDSTGIGRFIAALGRVLESGGTLLMAGATGAVRESFHVTRLDSIFRFYDDLASARAALK